VTIKSDVVLRAGPGPDFSAIGHVPGGTELVPTDCAGGWCRADFNGIAGFLSDADLGSEVAIPGSSARRDKNGTRSRNRIRPTPSGSATDPVPGNAELFVLPAPAIDDHVLGESLSKFSPEVAEAIKEGSALVGVDPEVMAKLAYSKSRGDPNAVVGNRKGLMLLTEEEMRRVSSGEGNVFDPRDSVMAAATIMEHKTASAPKRPTASPSSTCYRSRHEPTAARQRDCRAMNADAIGRSGF
jgi:Transglycosylase SLT domain